MAGGMAGIYTRAGMLEWKGRHKEWEDVKECKMLAKL